MPRPLRYATDSSAASLMITRTVTPRAFAAPIASRAAISEMYMTSTSERARAARRRGADRVADRHLGDVHALDVERRRRAADQLEQALPRVGRRHDEARA